MNKGAVKNRLICMMWVRWAGKNTQIRSLLEQYSQYFGQALSCKTRDFRIGECEWVDYYKVDLSIFANSDVEIIFLETNGHFGNRYGTRNDDVLKVLLKQKDCLKELEPEWFAKAFKKKRNSFVWNILSIYGYTESANWIENETKRR